MHEGWLEIELLEDTVVSRTGATAGTHQSLDYIPGANLMGAAAAALYDAGSASAWSIFHADGVVFGDALPLTRTGVAVPVPLAWHECKSAPATSGVAGCSARVRLVAERVHNLARTEPDPGRQLRQLRNAWVDMQTGELLRPALRMRMKTALEPGRGTVASGQLFGYQALPAGMCFAARIASDSKDWLDQVFEALCGEIVLGRSRSAEYGAARVTRRDAPLLPAGQPVSPAGTTCIYLLSDLCLANAYGQPEPWPEPQCMGIDGCQLDLRASHLRTRSYSPWNGYRRAAELERTVIMRGSVIVLEGLPAPSWVEQAQSRGIGLHTGQGLGQVLINPEFLASPQPVFQQKLRVAATTLPQRPDSALLDLLSVRARQRAGGSLLRQEAERFVRRLFADLGRARRAAGLGEADRFGPSTSQWRKLQAARARSGMKAVLHWAFEGEHAVARSSHDGWCEQVWTKTGERSFVEWFQHRLAYHVASESALEEGFGVFLGYVAELAARETRS